MNLYKAFVPLSELFLLGGFFLFGLFIPSIFYMEVVMWSVTIPISIVTGWLSFLLGMSVGYDRRKKEDEAKINAMYKLLKGEEDAQDK